MKFIPAKADELQIDLDQPCAALNSAVFELLGQLVGIRSATMAPSRNGNTHWLIKLKKRLPLRDRLVLQCALGDDPVRVIKSWDRVRRHAPHPILFFEKE